MKCVTKHASVRCVGQRDVMCSEPPGSSGSMLIQLLPEGASDPWLPRGLGGGGGGAFDGFIGR